MNKLCDVLFRVVSICLFVAGILIVILALGVMAWVVDVIKIPQLQNFLGQAILVNIGIRFMVFVLGISLISLMVVLIFPGAVDIWKGDDRFGFAGLVSGFSKHSLF